MGQFVYLLKLKLKAPPQTGEIDVTPVRMAYAVASETSKVSQIAYVSELDPALAPCVSLVCALSEPRDLRPRAFDPTLAPATDFALFGSTSTTMRRPLLASSPSPPPPHRSSPPPPQKLALHPRFHAIDALPRTAKLSCSPRPKIHGRPSADRSSTSADVKSSKDRCST
jgi:hypothetical protein